MTLEKIKVREFLQNKILTITYLNIIIFLF